MKNKNLIESAIANGYNFNIGNYISRGMDIFKKNPININSADADELRQLRALTDLQNANLVTYRSVLGKLQTIYELQAVPSWDVATIKKILPFVTIAGALSLKDDLLKRFSGGEHTILLRLS